VSLVSYCIF